MLRHLLYIFLILSLSSTGVYGQYGDLKENFLEAEAYFLFEEYNEALPLYLRIHRADPENDNINYKIGICFLKDPYQKEQAIDYLLDASDNTNPDYKENKYKERTAPMETYYYLGDAYLVNDSIDKALEYYQYFLEIADPDIYDLELVKEQIRTCERARNLKTKPVDYDRRNMSELINSRFADINPILSGDGNRLVYVSKRAFYDATFFAEKVNGEWQPPRNIIPELGVDGDVYPTCLSWDGNTMIIYRNDDFIGNLYMSEYRNGSWSPMVKLGENINTKYWESHGCLTKDGNTLYFTSNRKGGYEGLDIYRSEKQADGTWGPPKNLGPTINSRYNEDTPFITENGKRLYFSSYGHYGMGGYDVFYSDLNEEGEWGEPINMGYPVNTTDDNLFFTPVNNGDNALFSQYIEGEGFGRHDIYYLDIYSENNPRMYMITGSLGSGSRPVSPEDSVRVYLVDKQTGDTLQQTMADSALKFTMEAPKGFYDLLLTSNKHQAIRDSITIDETTDKAGLQLTDTFVMEPLPPMILTGDSSRIRFTPGFLTTFADSSQPLADSSLREVAAEILTDSLTGDSAIVLAADTIPLEQLSADVHAALMDSVPEQVLTVRANRKLKIPLEVPEGSILIIEHIADGEVTTDTITVSDPQYTYVLRPGEGDHVLNFKLIDENGDISLQQLVVRTTKERKRREEATPVAETPLVPDSAEATVFDWPDAGMEPQTTQDSVRMRLAEESTSLEPGELNDLLEKQDVSGELAEELTAIHKVNNDASALRDVMAENSDGALKAYLLSIPPTALQSITAAQLLQILGEVADDEGFTRRDIVRALKEVNGSSTAVDQQLNEMISYARGDLRDYLRTLDPEKDSIDTPAALLDHLATQVGEKFRAGLLIAVISDMAADRPVTEYIDYLAENAPRDIRRLLRKLDPEKEDIRSVTDLIGYLLQHAGELVMTEEELQNWAARTLAGFAIDPLISSDPLIRDEEATGKLRRTGGWLLAGLLLIIVLLWRRRKKKKG